MAIGNRGFRRGASLAIAVVAIGLFAVFAGPALTDDSAFIEQTPGNETLSTSLSNVAPGPNVASTVMIGNRNSVAQFQFGQGNKSHVGIWGGEDVGVGVLQAGDQNKSKIDLINVKNQNLGVIQLGGQTSSIVGIGLKGGGMLLAPKTK